MHGWCSKVGLSPMTTLISMAYSRAKLNQRSAVYGPELSHRRANGGSSTREHPKATARTDQGHLRYPAFAIHGCSRRCRSDDAGYFLSMAAGLIGRGTKLPRQFGHAPQKTFATQFAQNVHSNVQIMATVLSGGRSQSQHSQFGFSFIIASSSPDERITSAGIESWSRP